MSLETSRLRFTSVNLVNGVYELQTERQVMLDNILFIPGIGWKEVPVPTGFDYTPPFRIEQFGARTFRTNFNPDAYKVAASVEYYLSPTGNDANDGLTAGSPKQSLKVLITALNASPPTGATFFLAAGIYEREMGFDGVSPAFPYNVICPIGKAIITARQSLTWTKTAGQTNVWQSSAGPLSATVIDNSDIDLFGFARRLRQLGSIAAVDSQAGSTFFDSGPAIIYVHTYDSREPDSDIWSLRFANAPLLDQTTAQNMYFENIDMWGGNTPVRLNHNGSANVLFQNCSLRYGRTSNGFATLSTSPTGLVTIFNNCDCSYNSLDGWNYNGSQRAIEINCKGVWNGYTQTNTNDNGSTTHGAVRSVRVNGDYSYNDDRNVHDIGTTRNWLLGCKAGFAQNGLTDQYDNANFLVGSNTSSSTTLTWFDGCESLGGSASDLGSFDNSIARLRNVVGFNIQFGDGTIENY